MDGLPKLSADCDTQPVPAQPVTTAVYHHAGAADALPLCVESAELEVVFNEYYLQKITCTSPKGGSARPENQLV